MRPASGNPALPEIDDAEIASASSLSPEGAIFSRYQRAVLGYTGTLVPDTRENRAMAIRSHDQGLTFQEVGILQAMMLVENGRAVPTPALREAVDALPSERLSLMHRVWCESGVLSDQGKKPTNSWTRLMVAFGPPCAVVMFAWVVLASLPGSNDSVGGSPAPASMPKQEKPATVRAKTKKSVSEANLVEVQKLLKQRGFYESRVDGIYGPGTKAALEAFQAQNGLERTGKLDNSTLSTLRGAPEM